MIHLPSIQKIKGRLGQVLNSPTPWLVLIGGMGIGLVGEGLSKIIDGLLGNGGLGNGFWTIAIGIVLILMIICTMDIPQMMLGSQEKKYEEETAVSSSTPNPSPKIINKAQIETILQQIPPQNLLQLIEWGFKQYSLGNSVVPPVGELLMDNGEVHIKYGLIKGNDHYVIKIASGFFDNPKLGLPTSNGMMLAFNQKTGQPTAVLLDEGLLTDVRTAVAGAIAAKHLAPTSI
ncbi:MAG: hypothetical protein AAF490_30525, partial [Chloroflexota bacterium]